jgi:hypothetical protein
MTEDRFLVVDDKLRIPQGVVSELESEFATKDVRQELGRLSWWLRSKGHTWANLTLIRRWMANSKLEKKVAGNVPESAKSGSHEAIDLNLLFAGLTKEEREKRMRAYGWI